MPSVKTVGSSGQISLGKEYAGRNVLVEEIEPGVWLIKAGEFVPDSERWVTDPGVKADIDSAIEWAASNPPAESKLESLARKLRR